MHYLFKKTQKRFGGRVPRGGVLLERHMKENQYLSPSQFAKQLDLSTKTVYSWIQSGRVLSSTLPNGRYRIPSEELDRLLTGVEPTGVHDGAA